MGATCGKMCESDFCGGPISGEENLKINKSQMKGYVSRSRPMTMRGAGQGSTA